MRHSVCTGTNSIALSITHRQSTDKTSIINILNTIKTHSRWIVNAKCIALLVALCVLFLPSNTHLIFTLKYQISLGWLESNIIFIERIIPPVRMELYWNQRGKCQETLVTIYLVDKSRMFRLHSCCCCMNFYIVREQGITYVCILPNKTQTYLRLVVYFISVCLLLMFSVHVKRVNMKHVARMSSVPGILIRN